MTSRSERFRQRVQIERGILSEFSRSIPIPILHGLSRHAIESWKKKTNIENISTEASDAISELLLSLSEQLGIHADASKVVFSDDVGDADLEKSLISLRALFIKLNVL